MNILLLMDKIGRINVGIQYIYNYACSLDYEIPSDFLFRLSTLTNTFFSTSIHFFVVYEEN